MHPNNQTRANRAEAALEAWLAKSGEDGPITDPATLADLLADLMHWCDREGIDFDDARESAGLNYAAEVGGEE